MIGEQNQIDEWENIDGCHRKANGNLHYFINGLDQGVAASRLPSQAKKQLGCAPLVDLGYAHI